MTKLCDYHTIKEIEYQETTVKIRDCAATVIAGTLLILQITSHGLQLSVLVLRKNVTKDFLLTNAVQNVNKMNTGGCPHGLPPSACPICSGMGGGGSSRVGERPQKAGEMSYHQCAMIGAMMKAREQRLEAHERNLLTRAEALLEFQQNLDKMTQKMINFANQISSTFIFKPVAYTINNIVVPMLNSIKNIPNIVNKVMDKLSQIKQKFVDIQDKLNAIFGEAKAFIEKKVSEFVSNIKSKFEGLFKIFKRENAKDDDTKIDDDKRIFNLKTILHKILRKKKDDTENKSGS